MTEALTHRPFNWVVLAMMASCTGCATHGPDSPSLPAKSLRRIIRPDDLGIVPPKGLEARVVALWPNDKLRRAELPLNQILTKLPKPDFLADEDQAEHSRRPKHQASRPEPPLIAQQHYLAARLAWRAGLRYDAIRKLHLARHVAPNDPQLLRFLGRLYDEQANKGQSYRYFQQAAEHDPNDPYTLFMLARHNLDQGRPEAAIAILGHLTLSLEAHAPSTIAFLPLAHFYLGNALAGIGHDLAAIDEWHNYLATPIRFNRLSRKLRDEAFMLHRNQIWIRRRLGDAYNRLGQPGKALASYQHSNMRLVSDPALTQRLVFTYLRLRQYDHARQTVIDLLSQNHDNFEALALVNYLAQTGGQSALLIGMMHPLYLKQNRPVSLLLAMAELLDPDEQAKLMAAHLAIRPADHVVFEHLIRHRLVVKNDVTAVTDALQITASAITLFEQETDMYIAVLLRYAADHDTLLEAFDALSMTEQCPPVIRYLRARILAAIGRLESAIEVYRQLIVDEPLLQAVPTALIQLLIDHGQIDAAANELVGMAPHTEPAIAALWIQVQSETGQAEEASRHLEEMLIVHPTNKDLLLLKASLHRKIMDVQGCESILLKLLDTHPTAEPAYEALIDLYTEDPPADRELRFKHLWAQLRHHVPYSRVARRERARRLLAQKEPEFATAEQLLRDLLNESPMDHRTIHLLFALMMATNRNQDAESLLDKQLSESPTRRTFQALANKLYPLLVANLLRNKQLQTAIELADRALQKPLTDPRPLVLVQQHALLEADLRTQIEPKLRQTIARFSEHEADLLFHWAMTLERLNEYKHSEKILLELLSKYPNHALANNSLGYTWANRDKNLQRAHDMIQRALDAEPLNSAYLDSLGWVYYKLGRYQEAIEQLSKATMQLLGKNPIIFDHLGDTLFQLNRSAEAAEYWRDALQAITPQMMSLDPELQQLLPRVQVKLQAMRAKAPVPVANSPGAFPRQAADVKTPATNGPMKTESDSDDDFDTTPVDTKR